MARVAIVTDSTSDLPAAERDRLGIAMVPLNVHFGDEVFRDQIDITTDQFMTRLGQSPKLPTTSQPAAGLFEETFRRLAPEHDAIVAVLISAKLSGTVQSATIARDVVSDVVPVEVVDSTTASMGLGLQVLHAAELAAEGLDAGAIADRLRAEVGAYQVVFFVDTLEYLQRGGRIGKAAALIGGLLNLKPILRIDEGQVVPFERTRTRARAIEGVIDFVRGVPRVDRLSVIHSSTPDQAESLADRLAAAVGLPRNDVLIAQMSPVIGTHVGPGAMGVAVAEGEANPS